MLLSICSGARWLRRVRSTTGAAQAAGLGGFGASSSMAPAAMGGSGLIIPYGGNLSGFMPSRMGERGSGLSFSSRNSSMIGDPRSPFRLSPMNAGMPMSSLSFGKSRGYGAGGSLFSPAMGGGAGRAMDSGRQGVMPPDFGYPFYQPPGLLPLSSATMGMPSM